MNVQSELLQDNKRCFLWLVLKVIKPLFVHALEQDVLSELLSVLHSFSSNSSFCVPFTSQSWSGDGDFHLESLGEKRQDGRERIPRASQEALRDQR